MVAIALGAVVVLIAALATSAGLDGDGAAHAQSGGTFSQQLPGGGGFALAAWGGGNTSAMAAAAERDGCPLQAVFVTVEGRFVGFVFGAPAFVNSAFTTRYAGGNVPAGTPVIAVCRGPAPTPVATATQQPPPPPPPPPGDSVEVRIAQVAFDRINRERAAAGLPALRLSAALRTASEKYIVIVRDQQNLDHTLDGEPWDRARREGYPSTFVGEVLALDGYSGAVNVDVEGNAMVDSWMNSPPHRAILLDGRYADLGVGCALGQWEGRPAVYCVGKTGRP